MCMCAGKEFAFGFERWKNPKVLSACTTTVSRIRFQSWPGYEWSGCQINNLSPVYERYVPFLKQINAVSCTLPDVPHEQRLARDLRMDYFDTGLLQESSFVRGLFRSFWLRKFTLCVPKHLAVMGYLAMFHMAGPYVGRTCVTLPRRCPEAAATAIVYWHRFCETYAHEAKKWDKLVSWVLFLVVFSFCIFNLAFAERGVSWTWSLAD